MTNVPMAKVLEPGEPFPPLPDHYEQAPPCIVTTDSKTHTVNIEVEVNKET